MTENREVSDDRGNTKDFKVVCGTYCFDLENFIGGDDSNDAK